MCMLTVAPVVRVESELVYSGPGQSPTIECVVESDPKASVLWYHNGSTTAVDFTRLNVDTSKSAKSSKYSLSLALTSTAIFSTCSFGVMMLESVNRNGVLLVNSYNLQVTGLLGGRILADNE